MNAIPYDSDDSYLNRDAKILLEMATPQGSTSFPIQFPLSRPPTDVMQPDIYMIANAPSTIFPG